MFIKYEAEVSSRVSGGQRGVVGVGKCLLMERNSVLNKEVRVRRFAVIEEGRKERVICVEVMV